MFCGFVAALLIVCCYVLLVFVCFGLRALDTVVFVCVVIRCLNALLVSCLRLLIAMLCYFKIAVCICWCLLLVVCGFVGCLLMPCLRCLMAVVCCMFVCRFIIVAVCLCVLLGYYCLGCLFVVTFACL